MTYHPLVFNDINASRFVATADKTVTDTAAETSAIPTGTGSLTLPANFLTVGKKIRISGHGVYTTPAVTGGTVTIKVKLGSTVLAQVATSALLVGATGASFQFECVITCRSAGASGSVVCGGAVNYEVASAGRLFDDLDNGGAATTVDTTAQQVLDVTVTWDSASTSKIVKTTNALVEVFD